MSSIGLTESLKHLGNEMIPYNIEQLLAGRGYSRRMDERVQILKMLELLGIDSESEVGSFYLEYDPSLLQSNVSYEQLEDILPPTVDGSSIVEFDPTRSPVGMATRFVREVWEAPNDLICLTTTEGEGAYLCDMNSGEVFDFSLENQTELARRTLAPRWKTFFVFLEWYLS